MQFPKFAFILGLISLLQEVIAQQAFERHGPNYHAKVMIHRNPPQNGIRMSPGDVRFSNSNPYPPSYDPNRRGQDGRQQGRRPWKQGNRITKQEVVQNMAKALLTRKGERKAEWRMQKQEALKKQEERAKAKKLTNELRKMEGQPQPPPAFLAAPQPQPSQPQFPPRAPSYLQDSWKGGPAPRPRQRRTRIMRQPARVDGRRALV